MTDNSLSSSNSSKNGSFRYKTTSVTSSIDECLFTGPNSSQSSTRRTLKQIPSNSVIVTNNELKSMQNLIIDTLSNVNDDKSEDRRHLQEKKLEESKVRKQKMLKLAEDASKETEKTDAQIEDEARKEAINLIAQDKMNNDCDPVRQMKTLAARAIAFTVRDKQLKEKEDIAHREESYDRRMENMMEIERLKAIDKQAKSEDKSDEHIRDREIVLRQIREREQTKTCAQEARELDNLALRESLKKLEDKDKLEAETRRAKREITKQLILQENGLAIERKGMEKMRERKEADDALAYQLKKDAEFAQREAQEQELLARKKEEQQKMLAQQEGMQSKLSLLEEVRSRRAFEEQARKLRKKEKEEGDKKRRDMMELQHIRETQADDRRRMALKQQEDEEIFDKLAVLHQKKLEERESHEAEEKHRASMEHRRHIQEQIESKRDERSRRVLHDRSEGQRFHQESVAMEAQLIVTKDSIIEDLRRKGVDDKHLTELVALNVSRLLH